MAAILVKKCLRGHPGAGPEVTGWAHAQYSCWGRCTATLDVTEARTSVV